MPGYRNQKSSPSVVPVEESDGRISSIPESRISEEDQPETSTPLVCSTQVPSTFSSSNKTSGRHFKPLVKAMNSFVKMLTPSDNGAARVYLQNVGTLSFLGCEGMGSFIPATNSAYNCTQSSTRLRHWARVRQCFLSWDELRKDRHRQDTHTLSMLAIHPGLISSSIPDIQFVVQMTLFWFELQMLLKNWHI